MTAPEIWTLKDLVERLGVADLDRVWFQPAPGTATPDDVQAWRRYYGRPFELVERTLVEKPRDNLALCERLGRRLADHARAGDLGVVCWGVGTFRLAPGTVRVPAAAFTSWSRLPGRKLTMAPIPDLVPDLVAEFAAEWQSPAETARRRADYLGAGVRVVWEIDPAAAAVTAHTPAGAAGPAGELDGGDVLPGFAAALAELFAGPAVDRPAGAAR